MKNYIDSGCVTNQKMAQNSDKILQEVSYLDKTVFRGEVFQDEETHMIYKEGLGRLIRPHVGNHCYYEQIVGTWSRGILHGKRIEYRMNLDVFPKGYYANTYNDAKSVHIVQEIKKGVSNGPATLFVNEKKVCRTRFSDQIEFVRSRSHPVGKDNLISTDRAALNCVLVLASIICFLLLVLLPDQRVLWVCLGGFLYIAQLIEVFLSQTVGLLWSRNSWDDLDLFRLWFYELKKSRPKLTFSFTPTAAQVKVLAELHTVEQELAQCYSELQQLRGAHPQQVTRTPQSKTNVSVNQKAKPPVLQFNGTTVNINRIVPSAIVESPSKVEGIPQNPFDGHQESSFLSQHPLAG